MNDLPDLQYFCTFSVDLVKYIRKAFREDARCSYTISGSKIEFTLDKALIEC